MMYPAKIRNINGVFMVTFRDIPEAITQGLTFDDAILKAQAALLESLKTYFADNRLVPKASPKQDDEILIVLPASTYAKVLLLNTMIENRINQIQLANLMGVQRQQITKLVDLTHTTKIDGLQTALSLLGKQMTLGLIDTHQAYSQTQSQTKSNDMDHLVSPIADLKLPTNIAERSSIDVLMHPIITNATSQAHCVSVPNPFERKSQSEVIYMLADTGATKGFDKPATNECREHSVLQFLCVLTPMLTYFSRNSPVKYNPYLYLHHLNLVELERLAYNSGNDNIPTRAVAALQTYLMSLPYYDVDKIGAQSDKANEAFGALVMPIARVLNKYLP